MRGRGTQRRGRKIGIGLVFALAALGGCALATPALAAGSLSVTPNSNLTNGQTVTVTGSGFAASNPGGVLECNTASGEPTIAVAGNQVPVGCTNPLVHLTTTSASGALSYPFPIVQGTVGPPASGTDSSGGNAATDAANYPCPPTAAQLAAGVTCDIVFGDLAGDEATAPITFQGQSTTTSTTQPGSTTTSTTQPGSTTTTTAPPTTTTTTAPPTTTSTAPVSVQASPVPPPSSPSSPSGGPSLQATPTAPGASSPTLAFTGPGPGVWLLAFGGLVLLDLGYLVVTLYYRPRQLLARLLRRGGGRSTGEG